MQCEICNFHCPCSCPPSYTTFMGNIKCGNCSKSLDACACPLTWEEAEKKTAANERLKHRRILAIGSSLVTFAVLEICVGRLIRNYWGVWSTRGGDILLHPLLRMPVFVVVSGYIGRAVYSALGHY